MDAAIDAEVRSPGVRVLTLRNPRRKNALSPELLERLWELLEVPPPPEVRVFLLQAEGDVFCSGYDLSQLPAAAASGPLPDERLGEVLGRLETYPLPTVARIRGPAIGAGCELAASCDFRVGSPSASFALPPARLGIVYSFEGIRRIASVVGLQRARRMFLAAARIDADSALAWGLLDVKAEEAELDAQVWQLCGDLAAGAPLAIAGMKRELSLLARRPISDADRDELTGVRRNAFESEDAKEGREALLGKRAPRFTGR